MARNSKMITGTTVQITSTVVIIIKSEINLLEIIEREMPPTNISTIVMMASE